MLYAIDLIRAACRVCCVVYTVGLLCVCVCGVVVVLCVACVSSVMRCVCECDVQFVFGIRASCTSTPIHTYAINSHTRIHISRM